MKTVRFARLGAPAEVLELFDEPAPVPGDDDVLVTLTACAIHPSDLMNVRGLYGRPPSLPFVPGNDAAGVVAALGKNVKHFTVGERVMLLLGATGGRGTWREQVAVPARMLVKTPASLSDDQAGALWVNCLSIWVMAVDLLDLKSGDVLLQTAAGSQLGRAMVQLAKLRGFTLINVVRRSEQVKELETLGAKNVIATADGPLAERVKAIVGKAGLRWAIDAVGGETGQQVLESLSAGGTMISFGALDGAPISVNPGLVLFKELTLRGFWLTRWLQSVPVEKLRAVVDTIVGHAAKGELTPAIDQRFPLSAVREAVIRAETAGRMGSVVLTPDNNALSG